jgi:hypothetical protein
MLNWKDWSYTVFIYTAWNENIMERNVMSMFVHLC